MSNKYTSEQVVDNTHPDLYHLDDVKGTAGSPFISADLDPAGLDGGPTFTQTYSTTTATVPTVTWSTYVVTSTSDAPAGGAGVTGGCYDTAGHRDSAIAVINANRADIIGLFTAENKLAADNLTDRQLINAIIDAMQANGVAG